MRDQTNFTSNETVRRLLEDTLKERRVSIRKASNQIGVSHATIIRFLQGSTSDPETVKAVAGWLGINPATALNAEVPDNLAAQIAAVIEVEPQLAHIFSEAMKKVVDGQMTPTQFRELAAYAAWRFDIQGDASATPSDPRSPTLTTTTNDRSHIISPPRSD